MPLLALPSELLLEIAKNLNCERDISYFSLANTHLHVLLSDYLYRKNVKEHDSKALVWAAEHGSEKVVQILLNKDADVNNRGVDGNRPLQLAAHEGHENVVRMLLSNSSTNIDAESEAGGYGTALQAASGQGHEKIVEVLLDRGANVNVEGGWYGSALQAACRGGHKKIVRTLLNKNAYVNARGSIYDSALQAASAGGHVNVVKMLLDKYPNMHAPGRYSHAGYFWDDALYAASRRRDYLDALYVVSAEGQVRVVQTLLDGYTERWRKYYLAIMLRIAAFGGHEKLVRVLLDMNADVNTQENPKGTTLQAAFGGGGPE
ncbi:hypothetical protein AJ79_02737 [Helicocarpus griseus UAMH5409]|uniref:Uncharacterized protein n=1 Tax=Helicocarpus griseus UAMH5409 TaxID=1447875 RepID=A0A2B7Y105_9EURO|nr:hypothetical protein AJ79_02737 [Helicocarpus griseus UAMH5409]